MIVGGEVNFTEKELQNKSYQQTSGEKEEWGCKNKIK